MATDRLEELAKALLESRLPADCPERLGDRVNGCTHDDAVRKARSELDAVNGGEEAMMAEKCLRCGKELISRFAPPSRIPPLVCPVHGEDYELSQGQVIALVEAAKAVGEDANEPAGGLYLLMPGTRDKINAALAGVRKEGEE